MFQIFKGIVHHNLKLLSFIHLKSFQTYLIFFFITLQVSANPQLAICFNAQHGGQEPPDAKQRCMPPRSALKSINARLAVDYPISTMVICQIKAFIDV